MATQSLDRTVGGRNAWTNFLAFLEFDNASFFVAYHNQDKMAWMGKGRRLKADAK